MPALPPYIPARDQQLNAWALNFATLITASPGTYGLVAGDATAITAVQTTFAADMALVASPSTKTAAIVQAKNAAKIGLLATVRPYAQTIANNAGVSTNNKIALGINPRTSVPTPVTAPTTSPALTVVSTSQAGTIVRFRDATSSPSVKAKPYGVVAMQLFATTSATAITDPTLLGFETVLTKSPFIIPLGSSAAGKTAYFAARWQTKKGLVGPWSAIVSSIVGG